MHIILLGANGQLGSDIARLAKSQYHSFQVIPWTRADLDVIDLVALKEKLVKVDFDVLINCTSFHQTEQVEENAQTAFIVNAFAVREMAKACHNKNAIFIHISTDYVFGGGNVQRPLTEVDVPAPLNIYGASKLMGEVLAETHHDRSIILRVASLFGVAGASGKGGNFIETILRHAKEKGSIRVVADQWMSPSSTLDIAEMIFRLLQAGVKQGKFHAVNSGFATWHALAERAVTLCKVNATVEPICLADYPSKAMRPSYSVLENQKLRAVIGNISTWEQALQDYLREKHCV